MEHHCRISDKEKKLSIRFEEAFKLLQTLFELKSIELVLNLMKRPAIVRLNTEKTSTDTTVLRLDFCCGKL
ncbi:hypothetical protein WN51_11002 [Melipona quadrifasciata]|uniref:Uncharacterized protein n=1 Tax=Melipona quadrifasciata TaxID=166423 RepID=A0A0M9A6Q2_9HYME|nr:hypothetical protein WN51_11002 [Melipona quadrifasciata]